ncbi:MAG: DHHA1 domain-containing protein, partial [Candidatus Heimdallarchaeaceae archaeon]
AQEIVITDFIILIDDPLHYNTAAISSELQKRGVKGVAYLTVYPEETKVSLRLNRALSIKDVEKYRVDLLANTMSGGGHKGASGAEMENLDETLKIIKTWINEVNLNMKIRLNSYNWMTKSRYFESINYFINVFVCKSSFFC